MSATLIAFLFAAGSGAWMFKQLAGRAGSGNAKTALIGAGVVFMLAFIIVFTAALRFIHN